MIVDQTNLIYVMLGCAFASGFGVIIALQFFKNTKAREVAGHQSFTRRRLTGASPAIRKGHRR